jgi:hypothetical protein
MTWMPKDFLNDRYYCAHCPLVPDNAHARTIQVYTMMQHLKDCHDIEGGENGVDYYGGWQARQVHGRRVIAAAEAVKLIHFAFEQADYNADDFLVDCGEPE